MPVACCLSNVTRVTRELVRTVSLLPACFIAGRRNMAAVLVNNIHTTDELHGFDVCSK